VSHTGLIIGLGVGSGAMFIFLFIITTLIIRKIKTQRKEKMRQRFFNQNHGQLLQQLLPQRAGIAERMIVITLEEVEKATNNFDKARELGGGGHGTVYKGILSSLHVVAIKKSKIVIQREIDEFINEVAILSQINHRNVVKL
jgi:serine/threonine protein kinase